MPANVPELPSHDDGRRRTWRNQRGRSSRPSSAWSRRTESMGSPSWSSPIFAFSNLVIDFSKIEWGPSLSPKLWGWASDWLRENLSGYPFLAGYRSG